MADNSYTDIYTRLKGFVVIVVVAVVVVVVPFPFVVFQWLPENLDSPACMLSNASKYDQVVDANSLL